jgi:PAS domain S-box-containing protein
MGDGDDIEDLKRRLARAEAVALAAEERLRRAMEAGRMEHWEWDPVTDRVRRAGSLADLKALTGDGDGHLARDSYALLHPDDRERHVARVEAARRDRTGWHAEVRYISPETGEIRWVEERASPSADPLSGAFRIIGFTWDITERKRAEAERIAALRDSEARLAAAFASVPVGVAVIDRSGRAILSNAEYRRFLPNGLIASRDPETVARWRASDERGSPLQPRDWPSARALRGETVAPGQEMLFTDPSGREIWTAVSTAPVRDSEGNVTAAVLVISDIDAVKRAQDALGESEERLRGVLDGMAEAFGVIGPDFTILEHNQEALRMDGRRREEIVGRSHWDAFPGTEHSEVGRVLKKAMADRQPAILEHQYAWDADRALWLEMRVYPTPDGALAVFWRDVSERKAAESALRESEERYRALFESMDQAYAVVEVLKDDAGRWVDFRFVEVNRAFLEHTSMPWPVGKTATELLGTPNPRWTELYGQALDTGIAIRVEEAEPTLDRIFDLNIFALDRERSRVAVLFTNITARKKAEAALAASEAKFRTLFEAMDEAFAICELVRDPDGRAIDYRYVELNPAVVRHVGIAPETLQGRRAGEVFGTVDPWLLETYIRVVDEGQSVLAEHHFAHVDRWLRINVFPRGGDRFAALYSDVTERHRAAEVINEREERQTFLLKLSDGLRAEPTADAVAHRAIELLLEHMRLDRAYITLYRPTEDTAVFPYQVGNDTVPPLPPSVRLSDFPDAYEQVLDRTYVIEDDFERRGLSEVERANSKALGMRAMLASTLRKGERNALASMVAVSSRPRRWTPGEIALIEDAAERTWAAIERKRDEAALKASEERFQQFAKASAAGLWIRDAKTLDMEFTSPALAAIYGVAPDALLGDVTRWAALIVPEERESALGHLQAARRGEVTVHEFRIRRPTDQAFRWIRNTDFPLHDDGHIARIGGIAEDVTEAKLAVAHQGVLLAELQHRVRNIMAMVRAMASRTADSAREVADYHAGLEGRLAALARVQVLLTREANAGGSLREIVASEVGAQAHREDQFELEGPEIRLSPKAVEVLTLAFHELATNALKYGALRVAEGRLRVSWAPFEKRGRAWLALDWTESGAPPRPPSGRRGFGSELIENRIPYELGGTGTITLEPWGAHCRMEFPLTDGESILETDAPTPTTIFGGTLDTTDAPDLTGRSVLVVEDDYYIASDTAAALRGAGAEVLGPCPNADATLDLLRTQTPTHAVLDLNLGGGGPKFEIARVLAERGVPFVFMTGYDPDVIPAELKDVPRLQKPVAARKIVETVSQL